MQNIRVREPAHLFVKFFGWAPGGQLFVAGGAAGLWSVALEFAWLSPDSMVVYYSGLFN